MTTTEHSYRMGTMRALVRYCAQIHNFKAVAATAIALYEAVECREVSKQTNYVARDLAAFLSRRGVFGDSAVDYIRQAERVIEAHATERKARDAELIRSVLPTAEPSGPSEAERAEAQRILDLLDHPPAAGDVT